MKFKANQRNLINMHPSLDKTQLTRVEEGDEGSDEISDENECNDIDEGLIEEPKRKQWNKAGRRQSKYEDNPEPNKLSKFVSEDVYAKDDQSPLSDDFDWEKTNKSEVGNESENEDVFELMMDTPVSERGDSLK